MANKAKQHIAVATTNDISFKQNKKPFQTRLPFE